MQNRVRNMVAIGLAMLATTVALADEADVRPAPLGAKIERFSLSDFRGKAWSLEDFDDKQIVVTAFLGVECPLVRLYSTRLQQIADKYAEHGVAVIGINSNQQDSLAEMAHFARTYDIAFPLLKDPGNKIADRFGAQRTPEIFVLDRDRKVRYRGRIDDQYTYGIQRATKDHDYLTAALDELLAGQEVSEPETETVGCHIGRMLQQRQDSDVTYANQISRILQTRCVECHRPGEIAPFALTEYDEVVGWAEMIDEVVSEQRMPPWHASPQHGDFINDTRLSDEEKQLIRRWVQAGAPLGDPNELPPPREFTEGWRIEKPDLVIYMPRTFDVPAEGEVKYQYFEVDPGFTEDKWIKGAECRPDNRSVVHHIVVFVKPPNASGRGAHGLQSTWLAATAPGARPLQLRDGMAKFIPKRSKLVFQMHYTPNGKAQQDKSSIGLVFADPDSVRKEVVTRQAAMPRFRIPPGAENHLVEATHALRQDSLLLAMFPHMHLRGKAFRYTAIYPQKLNRPDEILLEVPAYDFNWQNTYELTEPRLLPAGTKIFCEARFDNSEFNLANPDPTASVTWGDQTWEEMMIGYFDMALADQDLTKSASAQARVQQFLAKHADGKAELSDEARTLAATALQSSDALDQLAVVLRQTVPQLDRICWTVVDDGKLSVELAAQDSGLRRLVGGKGIKVPAAGMGLTDYAHGSQTVVHADVSRVQKDDFKFLQRGLASSVHIPCPRGDAPGVLNFWSTDKDAFPDEAVRILEELARFMAPGGRGE